MIIFFFFCRMLNCSNSCVIYSYRLSMEYFVLTAFRKGFFVSSCTPWTQRAIPVEFTVHFVAFMFDWTFPCREWGCFYFEAWQINLSIYIYKWYLYIYIIFLLRYCTVCEFHWTENILGDRCTIIFLFLYKFKMLARVCYG